MIFVIPDTLQVIGSGNVITVRTDSQIATIVEIELFQEQVVVLRACTFGIIGIVVIYQCLDIHSMMILRRQAFGRCSGHEWH